MHKIAIILAFSEYCYELCRQCVATCWRAANLSKPGGEYHFFCYECNYNLVSGKPSPFKRSVDLHSDIPIDAEITQRDSSQLEWTRRLADITVYHDFSINDLDDFDYALFCHNDIYFKKHNTFDELLSRINDVAYNILAETALTCNQDDLSLRFRPSFIFVRTDKFRQANLSFINEHEIFTDDLRKYNIRHDGGAELFASYYSNQNQSRARPCAEFPTTWYKHFRINSDYGIEMHNIISPNDPQIQELLAKSKRYTDYYLYGKNYNQ